MVIFTDCKINIGLNVVRRRPDGYHDIETCMVPIPWHDVIEILPAAGTESTLTVLGNPVDCEPEKNLVMKAYRALETECHLPAVDIILQKIVPDGAGLGGGSSDASHTLKCLRELFGIDISDERLASIAARLGADCPLFVYDRPMIARGIGEILTPIDLPLKGYTIVIAKPEGVNISTRQAYSGVTPAEPDMSLEELLQLPVSQWQGVIKNDFEPSVFALAPQIAELKALMLEHGAVYASMSGSGASVYGIFESDKMAEQVIESVGNMPHFKYRLD